MASAEARSSPAARKPFYRILYVQVLIGIAIGVLLGEFWPHIAIDMKPLGDGFIKLIKMVISLIVFCTVVTGIAGMNDMKKVGRVGGKALIYFEVVSTLALVIGLVVGNWVRPGDGFNADPATLDSAAVMQYAEPGQGAEHPRVPARHHPATVTSAFTQGNILQVILVSILFGFALTRAGRARQADRRGDRLDARSSYSASSTSS